MSSSNGPASAPLFAPHDAFSRIPNGATIQANLFWLALWPVSILILSFGVSVVVGIVFGLGPAADPVGSNGLIRSYYALLIAGEIGLLWLFARWLAPQNLAKAVFDIRPDKFVIDTGFGLVLFAMGFIFSVSAVDTLMPILPFPDEVMEHGNSPDTLIFVLVLITVVIMAPLIEEIIIRGWLLPILAIRFGGWIWPILITSAFFGALHIFAGVPVMIYTTVLGITAGLARRMTGRLWAPIILHFANNLVSFL